MSRRRNKQTSSESDVSMTPMIDVVFQLLIYFLVTFTTPDVLARLDVSCPLLEEPTEEQSKPVQMIRVRVEESGFLLNGRTVTHEELVSVINKLARLNDSQPVLITCAPRSEHAGLVEVLDLCAGCGLSNISVNSSK